MRNRRTTNRYQFKCRAVSGGQQYHASLPSLIFVFAMLLMIVSIAPNFLNIENYETRENKNPTVNVDDSGDEYAKVSLNQ